MDVDDIRFRIAAARRILYREGCDSNIGGHVSARADGGEDAFWVTGLEYLDQTTPDRKLTPELLATQAYALLFFAGIWALLKGITDIFKSFQIKKLGELVAA